MQLSGKVAIVTGASSGIGRAIATAYAREGAAVTVDYVGDPADAEAVVRRITDDGGRAVAVPADVSDPHEVRELVRATVRAHGRLDVLVNNAGLEHQMPFLDTPLEVWHRTIAVNLTGPWLCTQEAVRRMVAQGQGGRVVNVSSVHEDLAMPTNAPYCAAKGGQRMLARTLAVELAPHGITVNNIAPGAIDTPMDAPLKRNPEQLRTLLSAIPLRRMGQPEEVAALAVFLASDAAAYATGSTFFLDGGMIRQASSL